MALAKVEILGGRRGADAISGTLASGTNILQESLSEAVRSGRAMADLQQGQERDLLGERESLRNFHEKKRQSQLQPAQNKIFLFRIEKQDYAKF